MPILDAHSFEFISRSAEQTRRVGMRLGALIDVGDVICLAGELGSGKTTLVKGIAAGWGSLDVVSSPTFVIINWYRRPNGQCLYHLDAFRLQNPFEAEELDLDLMLENGPLVIEWADHIRDVLPNEYLWVTLQWVDFEQRDLLFTARGSRYQSMLRSFRKRLFGGL